MSTSICIIAAFVPDVKVLLSQLATQQTGLKTSTSSELMSVWTDAGDYLLFPLGQSQNLRVLAIEEYLAWELPSELRDLIRECHFVSVQFNSFNLLKAFLYVFASNAMGKRWWVDDDYGHILGASETSKLAPFYE